LITSKREELTMTSEANTNDSYFNGFTSPVRKIGKASLFLAICFSYIPALYVWMRFGAIPTWNQILEGYLLILTTELFYYFIEPISYFPVLGEAGTYMSFLSGSIGSTRVPASTVAQDVLSCQPGTKRAELVSSIGIAGSVLCTLLFSIVAILAGNVILSFVPPFVTDMLKFVLPALYGTLYILYGRKNVKAAIFAVALALCLRRFAHLKGFVMMPLVIFATVAFNVLLSKMQTKSR